MFVRYTRTKRNIMLCVKLAQLNGSQYYSHYRRIVYKFGRKKVQIQKPLDIQECIYVFVYLLWCVFVFDLHAIYRNSK